MKILQIEGKHEASWITISTDEYDSMKATIEVLSDPDLMRQIKESEIAIKEGRIRNLDEVIKKFKSKNKDIKF
ncbi:MAG: hypothetical protein KAT28_04640 [Candidatus Aenigmarchaeota archaeon]|nr:hypothetical protein [Candidatus Aenigmarchaeota archaeon]